MFTNVKIIQGKEKESRIIQDPLFIYIMRELGEEKNIPSGQETIYLRQMARNVHQTMKSPFGKLESMRKNSLRSEIQFILYAIKDLETIPKIIGDEEYFRQTCFMDPEFMKIWNISRQETHRFLNKIKKYGPGNRKISINQNMIDRYIADKSLDELKSEMEQCISGIFRAWQNIWGRYQEISTFVNDLGNKQNKNLFQKLNKNY